MTPQRNKHQINPLNKWESLVSGMQETIDMMKDEQKTLEEYISIQEKVIDIAAKELERQSAGCPRDTHPDFNTLLGCCTDYPLRDMAECWRDWLMFAATQKEDK